MRRREFLAASAAAAVGLVGSKASFAADESSNRQLIELRTYRFPSAAKMQAFEQFLANTAIPAFNRAQIKPVGVFKLLAKDNPDLHTSTDGTDLWLLLPHESFESVAGLEPRLAADEAFQKAGEAILNAPKSDPAFSRYDSALLLAMEKYPRVTAPTKAPGRIFELRTYESPNAERAKNKLEMFNTGEFGIFKDAGMGSVFYGGAIIGPGMPQLTYMISFDDQQDVKKNWAAFFGAPDWKKLSAQSRYKDNVSSVIHRFLRPAEGSQI
jgi:hypothetical protein